MSLIYEALRKSEEQRRLGEMPTLSTPTVILTRRRRRPVRAIALVVAVALVGVAAWWLGRASWQDESRVAGNEVAANGNGAAPAVVPVSTPPVATVSAPPATAPAPAAIEPLPAPNAPAAPVDPVASAPVAPAAPPAGEVFANSPEQRAQRPPTQAPGYVPPDAALPEPLPDLENDPLAREVAAATAPATSAPPAVPPPATVAAPPRPAPAPAPVETAPTPGQPIVAAIDPNAGVAVAVTPPPAAEPVAPAPAASAPPAPAAAGAPGAPVPYLFELPLATRRALPPLKLNMHVWSADRARRFVIVDGTRAPEGGTLAPELTVAEIRSDGVVLEFRGTRFVLPRG